MKVKMDVLLLDDLELLLREINDFCGSSTARLNEVPETLENYLQYVAKTGNTVFPWQHVRPLFKHKLNTAIEQFQGESSSVEPCVHERFDLFRSAPFTIQRLAELIIQPQKHYKTKDKFVYALEKTVFVVSTVEPKSPYEDDMSNGMDEDDLEKATFLASSTDPKSPYNDDLNNGMAMDDDTPSKTEFASNEPKAPYEDDLSNRQEDDVLEKAIFVDSTVTVEPKLKSPYEEDMSNVAATFPVYNSQIEARMDDDDLAKTVFLVSTTVEQKSPYNEDLNNEKDALDKAEFASNEPKAPYEDDLNNVKEDDGLEKTTFVSSDEPKPTYVGELSNTKDDENDTPTSFQNPTPLEVFNYMDFSEGQEKATVSDPDPNLV